MKTPFHYLRIVIVSLCLFVLTGCGSSLSTVVNAVLTTDAGGTYAYVSVMYGNANVIDAEPAINSSFLTFGLPVDFDTDSGLSVDLIVPIYYGDLTPLGPGDTAALNVWDWTGYYLIFEHDAVLIPGQVELTEPTEGQAIDAGADVPMKWSNAGSQVYLASYVGDGDGDAGLYADYLSTGVLEMTVPAASISAGEGLFAVDALNGDAEIFGRGDNVGSFFLVGTADSADATIADSSSVVSLGSQELTIAATYTRDIEGLSFKVRETDPQQITQPGTVTVGLGLQKYRVSIAFVNAYDSNGNVYYSWTDKQIYRSEDVAYSPSFTASPGTTVVIGTNDASYRGATYSY